MQRPTLTVSRRSSTPRRPRPINPPCPTPPRPAAAEKRWTVFSSLWWLVMEFKYFGVPPALRYVFWMFWRSAMQRVYEAHKAVVLWQAKFDATVAARAVRERTASSSATSSSSGSGSGGDAGAGASSPAAAATGGSEDQPAAFSRAMALRRLHWKNTLLGEVLYLINIAKVGFLERGGLVAEADVPVFKLMHCLCANAPSVG
jgi:hypothetical protein